MKRNQTDYTSSDGGNTSLADLWRLSETVTFDLEQIAEISRQRIRRCKHATVELFIAISCYPHDSLLSYRTQELSN